MIEFSGIAYRSGSSRSFDAKVSVSERGDVTLAIEDERTEYSKGECEVEPKLGLSNRIIRFSDGVRFETNDHEAFGECEGFISEGGIWRLVDWMELRWFVALGSLVGVFAFVFLFLTYGAPVVAKYIAYEVPQSIRRTLTESSIDAMETYGSFEESYSMKIHRKADAAFERALGLLGEDRNEEFEYELRVYDAPQIGPNAFALPSGVVVATADFIKLCETEEQVVAVFLHEFAHVELQHGVRSLIQDAGVFLIVSLALGDLSSLGGMAASLPALAIESRYSQTFETEADLFSGTILKESGIGVEAMKEALVLLHMDTIDIELTRFISSHPDLGKRLEALESLENDHTDADGPETE
ncbi:MAG: M48 family metallopeptidase [Opitutaceae bacterium]|nr:M48 family metallopeptidase [Opitutaceae bacterium]